MATIWTQRLKNPISFLLLEQGDYLLLEQGTADMLILEQTGQDNSAWTQRVKN